MLILVVFWTLLVVGVAAIPFCLGRGWWRLAAAPLHGSALPRFLLALQGLSYLWYLALLIFPRTVGPDYSDLRFRTIYLNGAAMIVVGAVSGFGHGGAKRERVGAAILLVALWSYAAVISSVV